jgi:hypothetical protein
VILAGLLLLAGCSTAQHDAQRRVDYVDAHPELSDLLAESILAEQVQVGMSTEMVEVSWGKPSRVQSLRDEETPTLWVYGNAWVGGPLTNLYFDPEGTLVRYEVQDLSVTGDQGPSGSADDKILTPATTNTGALSKTPGGSY